MNIYYALDIVPNSRNPIMNKAKSLSQDLTI